jgi:hypothetical protein
MQKRNKPSENLKYYRYEEAIYPHRRYSRQPHRYQGKCPGIR